MNAKRILSLAVALAMVFLSVCVFAAETDTLTFNLTADGKNEVTVASGSTVTVTFDVIKEVEETEEETEEEDATYFLNSLQNEIKYDESFFTFVENSIKLNTPEAKGGLKEKFAGKRVYMNDSEATYKYEHTVGTFQLKVKATSGSGKVESTEMLAFDKDGAAFIIEVKDLTVKIGSSGGTGGGGGGGAGGGGGGGGVINPSDKSDVSTGSSSGGNRYTKDIFGTEHPEHTAYINGYPDGTVQPDGYITREEIAAIIYRIKDNSEYKATGEVFPDVEQERWSASEIECMAEQGVILGYPDGSFKPENNLTRAEFAALIYRFAEIEPEESENPLIDLMDTHWAYKEIKALCDEGLVQGYEDGSFRPENNITRAEVMTVINKLLGRCPSEEYVKSLDINPFSDLDIDEWYYTTVLEATITHTYDLSASREIKWYWE